MKKIICFLFVLGILLQTCLAAAERSIANLPTDGSKVIGARQYKGKSLDIVILKDGVTQIGAGAFADTGMNIIRIPDSTASFGSGWSQETGEALLVSCSKGSYAYRQARSLGLDFDCGGKKLAIVIGENYSGNTKLELPGPENDIVAMKGALEMWGYSVTALSNPGKKQILSAISSVFGDADKYDTCILYFSGHGHKGGKLLCNDYAGSDTSGIGYLTPQELGDAMGEINGRKLVIADCCYSGALTKSTLQSNGLTALFEEDGASDAEEFNQDFISGFSQTVPSFFLRNALLSETADTYVITACQKNQLSYSYMPWGSEKYYGYFTLEFTKGIGWDEVNNVSLDEIGADQEGNEDEAVSVWEAYDYALNRIDIQTAAVYPAEGYTSVSGTEYDDIHRFAPFRRTLIVKTPEKEQTAAPGEKVTFTVTMTAGTAPFTYQWEINRNDGKGWQKITGATDSSYTTSPVTKENNGYRYHCIVTDANHFTTTSAEMVLHVISGSGLGGLPKTGDDAPVGVWLLLAAGSAWVFLLESGKKKYCG